MSAVWELIRRHTKTTTTTRSGTTAKGMPPKGTRIPSTGDGKTSTNRKVKLDKPQKGRHAK